MNKEKTIILVVEDETDVLRINARMLTRRGYTVYTAENCRQAYEKLTEPTPDLLILDIMLPDGSGYDICERFRSTSDHPVIFLTGKGETCDKVEGLGHGGDYYLTKPYDPDELLADQLFDLLAGTDALICQKTVQADHACPLRCSSFFRSM